jgi:hypothetical protein
VNLPLAGGRLLKLRLKLDSARANKVVKNDVVAKGIDLWFVYLDTLSKPRKRKMQVVHQLVAHHRLPMATILVGVQKLMEAIHDSVSWANENHTNISRRKNGVRPAPLRPDAEPNAHDDYNPENPERIGVF